MVLFEGRKKDFTKDGGTMPALPESDPSLNVRVSYLFRVKALIDVGCHFGPDDLTASVWDELIVLAAESQYLDRVLDQRRERKSEAETAMGKARSQTGVPAPGGTLFPVSKPFRGSTR